MISEVPQWIVSEPYRESYWEGPGHVWLLDRHVVGAWFCLDRETGEEYWSGRREGADSSLDILKIEDNEIIAANLERDFQYDPIYYSDTVCRISLERGVLLSKELPTRMATLARRCFRWPGFRGMTKYLDPIVETKYTNEMSFEDLEQMPLWEGPEGSLRGSDFWNNYGGNYHDLLWFESINGGRVWQFSAAESGFITKVPDDFEEDDLCSITNYFVEYPWLYLMKLGSESKLWTLDMRTGSVVQQVSAMAFFQEFYCILAGDRNGILIKAYREDQETFVYFSRSIEA